MAACTGLSASWCPVHGDCTCPRDEHHGDFVDGMDDGRCPLHAHDSPHPIPSSDERAEAMAAELRRRGYTVTPPEVIDLPGNGRLIAPVALLNIPEVPDPIFYAMLREALGLPPGEPSDG